MPAEASIRRAPGGTGTASGDGGERAALGVLFVHGIGSQERGQTLAEFANPIITWLSAWYAAQHRAWARQGLRFEDVQEWLDRVGPQDPRRVDAVRSLLDHLPRRAHGEEPVDVAALPPDAPVAHAVRVRHCDTREDGPSCVRLEITLVGHDGRLCRTSWLLAESWWAGLFGAPSFVELVRWGFGTIARTIASQFGVRVRRAASALRRLRDGWHALLLLVAVGQLVLALYASLLAVAALVLLLVISVLPIQRLRAAFLGLQHTLAASLGDSYVLVTKPVQAAAIIGCTRNDLAWLAARAEKVAIVAHSQGAAVVNEVLREELAEAGGRALSEPRAAEARGPGQLRALLTLGSGLRKLDELRRLLGPDQHHLRSTWLTLGGVVVFTLGWIGALVQTEADALAGVVLAVAGGGLLVAGLVDLVGGPRGVELQHWADRLQRTGLDWVDYAASADPVPNGALFDEERAFPEHRTVHNRRSLLRDHTTYWSNVDEFVTDVLVRLSALDPTMAGELDRHTELIAFAARRRRWRVAWLTATRWWAGLAAAVVLVDRQYLWVPQVAAALQQALAAVGIAPGGPQLHPGVLLETLGLVAVVAGSYLAAALVWGWWDQREAHQLLALQPPGSGGTAGAAYLFAASGVVIVGVLVAVPGASMSVAWLLPAVFVSLLVVWFWSQLRWEAFPETAEEEEPPARTRAEAYARTLRALLSAVTALVGWAGLAAVVWREAGPGLPGVVLAGVLVGVGLFLAWDIGEEWRRRGRRRWLT